MQTAEAFGRGLFADYLQQETQQWTMDSLITPVVENILNPLGTTATFTKITNNEAKSLVLRCRLQEEAEDPHMASLFTYGFLRGILKSAFPKGELLVGNTMAQGAPMMELVFKATAEEEHHDRERMKNNFLDQKKKTTEAL